MDARAREQLLLFLRAIEKAIENTASVDLSFNDYWNYFMLFIVTGASSGIGFAIAKSLAFRKHDVIAVGRNRDRLESLSKYCDSRIQIIQADLSTETGRSLVVEKGKAIGNVDGIVHSAGSLITPIEYGDLVHDSIVADMNIHVAVPISLNNALHDELSGGRIVYIDSYSANDLRVGWSGYSIVKAAAQMAARSAVEEITNSAVIRVFPGGVRTPLVESVLTTHQESPTREAFKELELKGSLSDPDVVGEFVTDILTTATDEQLEERDIWVFDNPNDRIF